VNLISSTKTKTGLQVVCKVDANTYETGLKITEKQKESINITFIGPNDKWNYMITALRRRWISSAQPCGTDTALRKDHAMTQFIQALSINWEKISEGSYLRGIPAIASLDYLPLNSNVVFSSARTQRGSRRSSKGWPRPTASTPKAAR